MNEVYDPFHKMMKVGRVPELVFGLDAYKEIHSKIKNLKGTKVLIVSDVGVTKAGIADKIKKGIEEEGFIAETYSEIATEPTLKPLNKAVAYVREKNYDVIVGVGGGSAMDTSKVMAILKTNTKDLLQYVQGEKFEKPRLPLILVPTTAGTGSEVTGDAVMSVKDKKTWISDASLIPDVAIVDPKLSISMPQRITASSGLDVLCHAIEGMMTIHSNRLMDAIAMKSVELVAHSLERAYKCGRDIKARYDMMIAATLAGIVNQNAPATWPHSIGYTLTHKYNLPHGLSCIVGLPYVMRYNLAMCEEKFARMAEVMGLNLEGMTQREKALQGILQIREIASRVDAATTLKEIGVSKDHLDKLAKECMTEYPRPYNICHTDLKGLRQLYEDIWEGELRK